MLTSIKDAFNNERSYDAVSNTINSSVVEYSPIGELEKESKVMIEDAYKGLRGNMQIMTQTATECTNLMNNLGEVIYPSFSRISTMRGSFSTEGAFLDFVNIACEKFKAAVRAIVDKLIELYQFVIKICGEVGKFFMKFIKNRRSVVLKTATGLKRELKRNGLDSVLLPELTTCISKDYAVKFFSDPNLKFTYGTSSKFEQLIEYMRMYICRKTDRNYINRMKNRCDLIVEHSSNTNDFVSKLLMAVDSYKTDKGLSAGMAISNYRAKSTKLIKEFFNGFDAADLNAWVVREYTVIPAYANENHNDNTLADTVCDLMKEKQLTDRLMRASQPESALNRIKSWNDDNGVYSISSPLTPREISEKVDNVDIEDTSYPVKDLFGFETADAILDKIIYTASVIEDVRPIISNNHLDEMQTALSKISEKNTRALKEYQKTLANIRTATGDSEDALRRVATILSMKLYQDVNTSVVAMNQIIMNDVIKRNVCMLKIDNYLMGLLNLISKCNTEYPKMGAQ